MARLRLSTSQNSSQTECLTQERVRLESRSTTTCPLCKSTTSRNGCCSFPQNFPPKSLHGGTTGLRVSPKKPELSSPFTTAKLFSLCSTTSRSPANGLNQSTNTLRKSKPTTCLTSHSTSRPLVLSPKPSPKPTPQPQQQPQPLPHRQ